MSEVKGKVHTVFPVETKGNFSFRVLWLTTEYESQYPQLIELQFPQQKTDLLNNIKEGDIIEVGYNLRGRQWNDKVFNTLSGWKVNKVNDISTTANQVPVSNQPDSVPF